MENKEKVGIKNLIIQIISIIIASFIIWPLLDYLFFTRNNFEYKVFNYIVEPIIFGVVIGFIFWLFERRKAKKQNIETK